LLEALGRPQTFLVDVRVNFMRSYVWTCPKCHRSFTHPHQSHSCGPFTVEAFLEGRPPHEVALFRRFEELALGIGDVALAPAKGRIGFQHGRIFAAVNGLTHNGIRIHIETKTPIMSARVRRLEALGLACHVNHLSVAQPDQIDAELGSWLRDGYEWGGGVPTLD
jgi:hypothetical protein